MTNVSAPCSNCAAMQLCGMTTSYTHHTLQIKKLGNEEKNFNEKINKINKFKFTIKYQQESHIPQ